MKYIFKLLSVILALALALSFVACNNSDDDDDNDKGSKTVSKLEEWLDDDEGQEFIDMLEDEMEDMAEVEVSAKGSTLIIAMNLYGIDDLDADQKEMIADMYEGQDDDLKETIGDDVDDIPGLKTVVYKVCEEDGDLIVKVELDF